MGQRCCASAARVHLYSGSGVHLKTIGPPGAWSVTAGPEQSIYTVNSPATVHSAGLIQAGLTMPGWPVKPWDILGGLDTDAAGNLYAPIILVRSSSATASNSSVMRYAPDGRELRGAHR